jgi:hypothetical protein
MINTLAHSQAVADIVVVAVPRASQAAALVPPADLLISLHARTPHISIDNPVDVCVQLANSSTNLIISPIFGPFILTLIVML